MSRKFKYKIGTRVNHGEYGNGTIIDRDCRDGNVFAPYLVEFDIERFCFHDGNAVVVIGEKRKKGKDGHCWWCNESEIIPIAKTSKPTSWKVIIEGNGDVTTAKYIEGKNLVKTETVKRYYTDKFSVFKAIEALNNKMFGEEKTEELKFKPGDLVEVIENDTKVPTGLRGHIVRKYPELSDSWFIDFHVNYSFTHDGSLTGEPLPESTGYYLREKHFKKV